ncbi:MAG: hypothetical protein IKE50_05425 [Erysipelotrichaceae bacterium]|nr:hypothetical protein [Erysipelotrichaceae bacterium]
MSSELVLARILASEKVLITKSWFYSSEIRILNTNLVFAPLFLITNNWHLVRMIGMAILNIILFITFAYLAKQLSIRHIPWIGFLILGCVSKDYFLFVTMGSFYVPHFAISFISIGLIIGFFKDERKNRKILKLIILFALAFAAGLEGMRLVSITYLPLVLTAMLSCFISELDELKEGRFRLKERTVMLTAVCALGFVFSYAGAYVNSNILPALGYSYKMDGTDLYYSGFDFESLGQVIDGWIDVLGYQSDNMPVFMPTQLILKPLFALFFIILCWAVIDILKYKEKYDFYERFMNLYFLIAALVISALFVFTTTAYVNRYLLPVSVFSVFTVGIFFSHYRIEWQKWGMLSLIVVFIVVNTRFQIHYQRDNNCYTDDSLFAAEQTILANDCFSGYTIDHWNGHNLFTELTDGKIETWRLNQNGLKSISTWLQAKDHQTKKPSGKVFLLLLQEEKELVHFNEDVSSYIRYEDNERILYIFDNYEQLKGFME